MTAIIVLFYFVFLLPNQRELDRWSRQVEEKSKQLKQAESIFSNKDTIYRHWEELNSRLEISEKQFNTDFKSGAALVLLISKAGELGVQITSLEPLGILQHEHFWELPLKIGLQGQFPAVISFLAFCENLPNLAEIRRLEIEPVSLRPVKSTFSGPESRDEIKNSYYPQLVNANYTLVIYSVPQPGLLPAVEGQFVSPGQSGRENPFSPPAGFTEGNNDTLLSTTPGNGAQNMENTAAEPPANGDETGPPGGNQEN